MNRNLSAALLRTADWLDAHPDQHIAGARVRDPDTCAPPRDDADPETLCYCAAGRLAYELGYGYSDQFVHDHASLYIEIYFKNDPDEFLGLHANGLARPDRNVITFLKELAA